MNPHAHFVRCPRGGAQYLPERLGGTEMRQPPSPPPDPCRQRGAAALVVTMPLCVRDADRRRRRQPQRQADRRGERAPANQYRSTQSFEAAEAGLRVARLARPNDGAPDRRRSACRAPTRPPPSLSRPLPASDDRAGSRRRHLGRRRGHGRAAGRRRASAARAAGRAPVRPNGPAVVADPAGNRDRAQVHSLQFANGARPGIVRRERRRAAPAASRGVRHDLRTPATRRRRASKSRLAWCPACAPRRRGADSARQRRPRGRWSPRRAQPRTPPAGLARDPRGGSVAGNALRLWRSARSLDGAIASGDTRRGPGPPTASSPAGSPWTRPPGMRLARARDR